MRLLPRLPLRWWLVGSHGLAVVLPLGALLASGALATDLRNQTREDLEHQASLVAMLAAREVGHRRASEPDAVLADVAGDLSPLLARTKSATLAGIRLVDPDGVVVATSGALVAENLRDQPEVEAALRGEHGLVVRPRPDAGRHPISSESRRASVRIYVALPVELDGERLGAVVLSRTPREELQALYHMAPGVVALVVVGILASGALSALAAVAATRSFQRLGEGARRIAAGDFAGLEELSRPAESHVDEVARTSAAVATMAGSLRDRLAYIGEFASNVSHEFKTPIATLRGTFELLADDDGMPEEQRRRFLENGAREVARLERLVGGLLELARADEVKSGAEVDVDAVLREVAARERVGLAGEAGVVTADRAQVDAIVTNLVHNARRHGGPAVTVSIVAFPGGFEVIDDGRGISEANVPRVFERFFTTDRVAGTGLGLALVRTIARRLGGDATVTSRPGRTAFRVTLRPGARGPG